MLQSYVFSSILFYRTTQIDKRIEDNDSLNKAQLTLTSSSSETFLFKSRKVSSFSASAKRTLINSSCKHLIISSFCLIISVFKETSSSALDGDVRSTISDNLRIRSLALDSCSLVSISCCLMAANSRLIAKVSSSTSAREI